MFQKKKGKKKRKLIYGVSAILLLCWLIPLLALTYLLLFLVTGRMNAQIEKTIVTSADKAIEICQMQMTDVVTASRNASYMSTIRSSYLNYLSNGSEEELYNSVTQFLTQQYKYNQNLRSTMLIFLDNMSEIYYTYGSGNAVNYLGIREFQQEYQEKIMIIAAESSTGVQLVCIDGHIFMIRNMVDSSYRPYAVIIMELNAESIFESLNSVWGSIGFRVYVNDEELITAGEYGNSDMAGFPQSFKQTNHNSIYVPKGREACVYKVVKEADNWIAFRIKLDSQAILDELEITKIMVIMLLLFMIPLILIIFAFLYLKVNRPVGNLVKGAREIMQGNYGHQIEDTGSSLEFDSLEKSFNAMSMELKHQFQQIYLEELELKDAQIMALQSQINPHFLNNTLEIINWECRLAGNTKVSSMIEALSVMLNATMNRRQQNMIPLSEELSYVDAYLLIIQQRFGSRLRIKKNIDHSILWVEVPRLIIQPIIENAVEHGMDAKNQGRITLDIYIVDEMVHIEVTNNGVMTEADRKKVAYLLGPDYDEKEAKSTSLGIRNVNRRLKIIYGEDCGLTIGSNAEGYTVSTIVIDMNYNKGEQDEEETDNMD